jgi:hypothetical protein
MAPCQRRDRAHDTWIHDGTRGPWSVELVAAQTFRLVRAHIAGSGWVAAQAAARFGNDHIEGVVTFAALSLGCSR